MTPKTKKLLGIGILLIIVALFIYYIIEHISDFKQLSLVNPIYLFVLIALFIFTYYLISIITKNLLYPLGVKLKGFEAFALSIVTGFYNLITPFRGGTIVRAGYLKKKHNFSYTDFLATLSASYVLIFLIASLIGIISTLAIYFISGIFSWILILVFAGIFFPLLFIVVFSPRLNERKNKWINRFIRVINGWNIIKNNKKVILIIAIASLLQIIVTALMLYFQFGVFGIEIDFIACLFLASIVSLSILISITPAGLGINEAVIVFSALTIGITPAQSLLVALLGRAISFLVLFTLGPIFSALLIKYSPNSNQNGK